MEMRVLKNDGTLETFDRRKVEGALVKSGASGSLAREVTDIVEGKMREGMKTSEIYRLAFETLASYKPGAAFRYGLKRALMDMGPEGYPFETYVGAVLAAHGHEVKLRQILNGKCIQHEVDVVARKMDKTTMYECKYHNKPGLRCHIQNALYTYARFLDLRDAGAIEAGALATNTKFSYDVIQYAQCVKLGLLGWSYPNAGSLQELIEGKKLYPVNMLTGVDRHIFYRLHSANIITVKEFLLATDSQLVKASVPSKAIEKIRQQAREVMNGNGKH